MLRGGRPPPDAAPRANAVRCCAGLTPRLYDAEVTVQQAPTGRPSSEQLAAWRGFLRAHAHVVRRLESELVAAGELPLASYDVLVQLTEAPLRRLRMTELADRVLLSRSGLTRLVDRLEREGLVRREPCLDDARGLYAVATDEGVERLRRASRVHLDGVRRHFVDRFQAEELAALGELLARLST
jgi:DNA-binding MarR family transcriptional regulator